MFVPPSGGIAGPGDVRGDAVPPREAVEALQRWNSSPMNKYRVFATFWSFLVVGMNDGSYGVSLNFEILSILFRYAAN
jgi:hypothetical protein